VEDAIIISRLELVCRIGVTEEELANQQRLTVSLRLIPARGLSGLLDEITNTVDYAAIAQAVQFEALTRPRRLIETLAEEIASMLLKAFPLRAVEIELRKYLLQNAAFTAVSIRREAETLPGGLGALGLQS
jgi:dihydroneopterin aldolase